MESICGSTFWNHSLAWQSESPDLPQCFQETVLVWLPCAFLWLLSPIEYYKIRHLNLKLHLNRTGSRNRVPWTLISTLKVALALFLITLCMCQLTSVVIRVINYDGPVTPIYPTQWITPLVQLLTFSLATIWILVHRSYAVQSSGVLFIFWLLLSISSSVTYYSLLKHLFDDVSVHLASRRRPFLTFFLPPVLVSLAVNSSRLHSASHRHSSDNSRVVPLLL